MRSNDRFGLMHEYAKVGYVGWIMMCHNSKLRLYLRAIVSLSANTRISALCICRCYTAC